MGIWRGGETITCIFIDKYLGGGWSAVALILISGLEVWWCVLFAGLSVAYVLFGMKCYHLHEEYLASFRK